MKMAKYLMMGVLVAFLVGCSGSSAKVYDECVAKTVEKAKTQAPGNLPAEALKPIQAAAETGCQICKNDPKGAACKVYMEALK